MGHSSQGHLKLSMTVLQLLWNFHHLLLSMRKFPENFTCIPVTNQFLWQLEIFDFFIKVAKFEFGLILEVNFLKIGFLEASSPYFPLNSPESVPGSAKIISWTFGIRKNISFEILKVLKLGGPWRFFKI